MKKPHSSFLILLPLILQHVLAVQGVAGDNPSNDQHLDDYVALLPQEQQHPSGLAAAVDHGVLNDVNLGLTTDDDGNDDDEYDDSDDNDEEDDTDEDDIDEQLVPHYDIDHEDSYYGLLQKASSQEQGDDLGEELLVEEDAMDEDNDDDDDDTVMDSPLNSNDGGLLFEDDEAPLDFKNDDQVDLDQLLFEASQKDHSSWGHEDIDQLLANADDALYVDPQDDALDEEGHPDHTTDTVAAEMMDSIFQQQQQQQQQHQPLPLLPPPGLFKPDESTEDDDDGDAAVSFLDSSSQYKVPLFGILVLVILVYKVSHKGNKSPGGPYQKFLLKGEKKGLPLHIKDLNTQDSLIYPNNNSPILATSPISVTTTTSTPLIAAAPTPTTETHTESQHLGRRSSSSSTSSARKASLSGTGTQGGHARRISLGHPNVPIAIKESKWEEGWDDDDKRRQ